MNGHKTYAGPTQGSLGLLELGADDGPQEVRRSAAGSAIAGRPLCGDSQNVAARSADSESARGSTIVSGIDPGASGGIAHLVAGVLEVIPMPWITNEGIDGPAVRQFLMVSKHVFIEQIQVRPGPRQGIVSAKTMLTQWGRVCGIVEGLGIPLTLVHPQTWRKEMECRIPSGGDEATRKRLLKARSVARARQLWPRERFLPTEKCRVANDGMCEAALIAEFGRRKLAGETWRFAGGGA